MAGYYDQDKSDPGVQGAQSFPEPGYGAVSEYMVSSLPWVTHSQVSTGATAEYNFPHVARYLQITNNATAGQYLYVGFTKNGVEGGNYYSLNGGQNVRLDLRVKNVFLRAPSNNIDFCLLAGLTMIPAKFAPTLTGSVSTAVGKWEGVG